MIVFSRQYAEGRPPAARRLAGTAVGVRSRQAASGSAESLKSVRSTGGHSVPAGFTLIEMLVVMAIIVLAVTLAIPAIRSLTGSRSEQAAQNSIAAFVASARANAIGLQQSRGVLFYIDKATDRVTLAQVMQSPFQTGDPTTGVTAGIVYLDIAPNIDALPLPPGIRVWTLLDQYVPTATPVESNPFPGYRYLGFDDTTPYVTGTMDKAKLGGVILFDAQGRLLVTEYGFRFITKVPSLASTALQDLAFSTTTTTRANFGAASTSQYLRSQIGFVMFDRETFNLLQPGVLNPDGNASTAESTIDPWIDTNSTPVLINRSNGTLMRAE